MPQLALARRLAPLVLIAVLAAGGLGAASVHDVAAGSPDHRDQLRFMWAMAGQESGWDYYARNASSGAFGKYQIMPFNWPVWAGQYLGDARADQTPWNQERVAYAKLRDLYRWLGSWKRVAYWWLTGRTDKQQKRWSSYARGYVDNIMQLRKRAPADPSPHRLEPAHARSGVTGVVPGARASCASRSAAGPGRSGVTSGTVRCSRCAMPRPPRQESAGSGSSRPTGVWVGSSSFERCRHTGLPKRAAGAMSGTVGRGVSAATGAGPPRPR